MKNTRPPDRLVDCWNEMHQRPGPGIGDTAAEARVKLGRLSRTIEGEIIPRLMLAFDSISLHEATPHESETEVRGISRADIDEFVHLLLTHDAFAASQYVRTLREQGVRLQAVYLELLAPSARELGVRWENDDCNFTEVTMGVARMHQVLLEFSPCFCAHDTPDTPDSPTAIIVPLPGEQHTFGLFMVVEFFRRAGWNVYSGSPASDGDMLKMVAQQRFDIVGLSVSAERHVGALPERIRRIRSRSLNPGVHIIVGGNVFATNRELGSKVGADAVALDGREAVDVAQRFVDANG
ncbi:MAG: cobalamin-dependent protein [Pseudomonadota bacterium]